jgi:hypothetical protein
MRHSNSTSIVIAVSIVICGLLSPGSRDAHAQVSDWEFVEFKEAIAAFSRWECRRGWDILWPFAKAGNSEARYLLWSAHFNTSPPGLDLRTSPQTAWDRHKLTLGAYAGLARIPPGLGDPNHRFVRREIQIYLRDLSLGANGARVAQCYNSDGSFRDCLTMAVTLGVVPKFEDYAEEVEKAERETGKAASCWYPH